jgi:hypothetical protein
MSKKARLSGRISGASLDIGTATLILIFFVV